VHNFALQFDLDELGVIMPDDNDPALPYSANLPPLYWNAAGSMLAHCRQIYVKFSLTVVPDRFAYLFGQLASMGVDVLGHSQLAGSPAIPEWGIPLPQYGKNKHICFIF
jgi:hypothetical protein